MKGPIDLTLSKLFGLGDHGGQVSFLFCFLICEMGITANHEVLCQIKEGACEASAQGPAWGQCPFSYGIMTISAVPALLGILESISWKSSLTLANTVFPNLRALRYRKGKWYSICWARLYAYSPVHLVFEGWKPSLTFVLWLVAFLPPSPIPCWVSLESKN